MKENAAFTLLPFGEAGWGYASYILSISAL